MKKMLKVLTGLLVVCLLSIGIAATAFAIESPSTAIQVSFDKEVTQSAGERPDWDTAYQLAGLDKTKDQLALIWFADLETEDHTLTMTINYSLSDTLYVLHKSKTNGWELVGKGTGKFTVTLTDLSPVVVYAGPESAAEPEEETTPAEEETTPAKDETKSEEATSPKTGENSMLLIAAVSVILLGGVLLVTALKKKAE